jgi:hypothetical protein
MTCYAPDGFGRMVYASKAVYDGEWEEGKRSGHGALACTLLSKLEALVLATDYFFFRRYKDLA